MLNCKETLRPIPIKFMENSFFPVSELDSEESPVTQPSPLKPIMNRLVPHELSKRRSKQYSNSTQRKRDPKTDFYLPSCGRTGVIESKFKAVGPSSRMSSYLS